MKKRKHSNGPQSAYVLRVSVRDIKPQIWRKLTVPDDYTLADLHDILQAAFGWDNCHLHSFTIDSTEYRPMVSEMAGMGFDDDDDAADEGSVCLYELDLQPKQKFAYLYDFGDSWEHVITVSQIIPLDAENTDMSRPRCLGGKRAGPPEDSGGPWGYENMFEILQNPAHEEYDYISEWIGDFDPEYFNKEEINARLDKMFKPKPKKPKGNAE